jgi:hypothetical protein
MTEINKKSILKNRSLFNDVDGKKKKIIKNPKSSSLNNLALITRKCFKLDSKKNLDLIEFIKQKNKFVIESSFDVNGTREFLASKEVAMRAIRLNDEIIEENKVNRVSKNCLTNKNLIKINISNFNDNIIKKKSNKIENEKKATISPRKSRKSAKIRMKLGEEFNPEKNTIKPHKSKKSKKSEKKVKFKSSKNSDNESNIDNNSSINNNNNENNIIFDKADNESLSNIYKFFIDNANESEEIFNKKLKKELKKVENMKQNKDKEKEKEREKEKEKEKINKMKRKSMSKKDLKYKRHKRLNSLVVPKMPETQSVFMFSEFNKNLMKDDDIDVSSIGEHLQTSNNNANKKKVRRAFGSIQINNRQVKEKIHKQMDVDENKGKFLIDKQEINSDKDSIISILSDLM